MVSGEPDYLIIGAGSAGCVLANRLSANPGTRVTLIEAGGRNRHPLISIPKGIARTLHDPRFAWHYRVGPSPESGHASGETWIRGRGLGGSSAINGMVYVRGQPDDFHEWAERGGEDWDWQAMLTAFRALEDHELGSSEYRGIGGPVHISSGTNRHEVAEAFIEAGRQSGWQVVDDLNTEDVNRIGYYCHTILKGFRVSAASAFLDPVRSRPNLQIVTDFDVEQIVLEEGKAVGVRGRIDGRHVMFRCKGEVIVCCGTLNSPTLLQRSGIGDPEALNAAGVVVQAANPQVGRGMREHLGIALPYRLRRGRSMNQSFYGIGLVASMLRYLATRKGPLATGPMEVGALLKSGLAGERTDMQLYMSATTFAFDDTFAVPLGQVERLPGLAVHGQAVLLTSRGEIAVTSPRGSDAPAIRPNWLSTDYDQHVMVRLVRTMRTYMQHPVLAPYLGKELLAGLSSDDDSAVLEVARRISTCGTHAVGTCAMGRDRDSVVDPQLKVRGIDRLRVADCSVMPSPLAGNTNAAAMAVGWRAADIIQRGAC